MKEKQKVTKCYIASYLFPKQDSVLQGHGISNGLISFAIPNLGVAFRCLGAGDTLNMEFSVFFSLLEFTQTKLKEEDIKSLLVCSSNPHFVFSFTTYSNFLKEGSAYRKLLNCYMQKISIQVSYIKPQLNQALHSTADYPSVPHDRKVDLDVNRDEMNKIEFKPFQKGIKF